MAILHLYIVWILTNLHFQVVQMLMWGLFDLIDTIKAVKISRISYVFIDVLAHIFRKEYTCHLEILS